MKTVLLAFFVAISAALNAQSVRIETQITGDDLPENMGRVMFYALPDSSLIKGAYVDSSAFSTQLNARIGDSLYAVISAPGFTEESLTFQVTDATIDLGKIHLVQDLTLDEVSVVYKKPVFERTMDGISVNVKGTTLEQLNTLFDVLKASPRLTSPDDESIEIIGLGSPLILVDRQPIISNDELKAIPADQVERVEIITSPSAKYRAQSSGGGVIEVYTNNFTLEGYRATINVNGGVSTQLQPVFHPSVGLSYKKKKFTLNGHWGLNYFSALRNGQTIGAATNDNFGNITSYENQRQSVWQYYNVKMAYALKPGSRITMGINGNRSNAKSTHESLAEYYDDNEITLRKEGTSTSKNTWARNTIFLNYTMETDTFGSVFEINTNYLNRVNDNTSTNLNSIDDILLSNSSDFSARILSDDRPNIGEIRVNYEHNFDTTGWRLDVGGEYSLLFNNKAFGRETLFKGNWSEDPTFTNSYDYREDIGAVYAEVSKKWDQLGFRIGARAEYTRLDGYSRTLEKQFMDSSYTQIFPNASILYEPNDTIGIKLYYNSGIDRPQFNNYDPFVRVEDSLSIEYGNPYLRPANEHTIGLEIDLFQAFNFSVSYGITERPISSITFVNENTFISERTPWNAQREETVSLSMGIPFELPWLSGWTSLWTDYSKYYFTDLFQRAPFENLTFGIYSYLTFKLKHDFSIMNRASYGRWGTDEMRMNGNLNWGIRLTKKFYNGDFRIFAEASNILPIINKYERTAANFVTTTYVQNNFTSFRLGAFFKFGRLKAPTNIQESSSGQSNRL